MNRIRFYLLTFMLSFSILLEKESTFSQPLLDPNWPENPKLLDPGHANSVQQTVDGGYIVTGIGDLGICF